MTGNAPWRLIGYYGYPKLARRKESWQLLQSLSQHSNLPWCCIADYNDSLSQTKKRGRRSHPQWLINGFREAIEASGLIDIGMQGYQFMWERSRGTQDWIEERLNRVMASYTGVVQFSNSKVYSVEALESDHMPIFMDLISDV